jgi:hypothetical protein
MVVAVCFQYADSVLNVSVLRRHASLKGYNKYSNITRQASSIYVNVVSLQV